MSGGEGLPSSGQAAEHDGATSWSPATQSVPELFGQYARLRAGCPVAFTEDFGGFWTLFRYADVRRAATDPAVFRSGRPFVVDVGSQRYIPESLNPPEHTAYRRLLNPHFLPARIAALEPTVRGYAVQHLRRILETGSGDFVTEVVHPLPTRVLCAFLNLPDEMWPDIKAMNHERTVAYRDADRAQSATEQFFKRIKEVIDARRRAPLDPAQDVFSALLKATVDGRPLPDDEIAEIGYQLIVAGADTTSATLSSAAYLLAEHTDQQARLRADPALIPSAVEEVLRMEPALHYMGRTVAGTVELHGRTLADGDTVVLNYASANRDASEFDDPDTFDVGRTPNHHVTFGHGIHKCVGAPLARLELTVVLQELLARTSEFTLARPAVRGAVFPSNYRRVPLRVTPAG